jgi:hypothetical protein
MNPDIAIERDSPSFPVRKMTYWLDGGQEITKVLTFPLFLPSKLKEKIMLELERDPAFRVSDQHDLSLMQIREHAMQKVEFGIKLTRRCVVLPIMFQQNPLTILSNECN